MTQDLDKLWNTICYEHDLMAEYARIVLKAPKAYSLADKVRIDKELKSQVILINSFGNIYEILPDPTNHEVNPDPDYYGTDEQDQYLTTQEMIVYFQEYLNKKNYDRKEQDINKSN